MWTPHIGTQENIVAVFVTAVTKCLASWDSLFVSDAALKWHSCGTFELHNLFFICQTELLTGHIWLDNLSQQLKELAMVDIVRPFQSSAVLQTLTDYEQELFIHSVFPDIPTAKLLFIISHEYLHLTPRSLLSPTAFTGKIRAPFGSCYLSWIMLLFYFISPSLILCFFLLFPHPCRCWALRFQHWSVT